MIAIHQLRGPISVQCAICNTSTAVQWVGLDQSLLLLLLLLSLLLLLLLLLPLLLLHLNL